MRDAKKLVLKTTAKENFGQFDDSVSVPSAPEADLDVTVKVQPAMRRVPCEQV